MRGIEWTARSLNDLTAVERTVGVRIKQAVERLAATGGGSIRRLQGIHPAEYRLRVGDYRVRFTQDSNTIRILRVLHRREAYR
ncbi:MAG: type II toxin-antitoxin system RelE/ParE family toxin [bacterium]|nr:type II toxin-antitoxin system RelE/ParE family toxin [bacterium]